MTRERPRVGLLGGRGYAGEELLRLLARHPRFRLAYAASASLAGAKITQVYPDLEFDGTFVTPEEALTRPADLVVLALPNGRATELAAALDGVKVLDLSADHRFNPDWAYGLTEHHREAVTGAARVANPGCYATGAQLALAPLAAQFAAAPVVFGVSGYSGAGRRPSPRNDPERLADNLLPYSLTGHVHEREISAQLGRPVRFMPHVASFFRGISLTCAVELEGRTSVAELDRRYRDFYRAAPLIDITAEPPEVRGLANTPRAAIGGFAVDARDRRSVTLVCCLDNLLKGAASQAMQNLNLMCGLDELEGIADD